MPDIRLILPRPHDAQQINPERKPRDTTSLPVVGRRFGKTTLGGNLLADPVLKEGLPCAWFAPTYRLLRRSLQRP